jgi:hypothetical protein
LNKLFEEDRQREMRDKTGRASAEHRVIQQALRFAAGNGNDRELRQAIASFNETVA